jgi:UDP-N-acetylmuramoyl-tripeptide--D-alanyl-D-alanine ligase
MTALWTAAEAARAVDSALAPAADWSVAGLSIDTRSVADGDLFVALRGPRFDGHDFVTDALSRGAAAALVDRAVAGADPRRLLIVRDTQAGLEDMARAARARSPARIVAVTGSVGKTGTKEALAMVLAAQAPTHASSGNLNNHIGLPLSLARMPADAAFGVFEIGMNHAGEITPLSAMLRPHAAIITTVEGAHLEFFPDVAAIADAKAEIFAGLDRQGTAILNRDNPYFDRLAAHAAARGVGQVWSFGAADGSDARLVSASLAAHGSDVEAIILGRTLRFRLPLPGRHLVLNSLAVLLGAAAVDADISQAAECLAGLAPVAGRGVSSEVAIGGGRIRLIDETYNASPAAMRAAFDVLAMIEPGPGGRRIAALGDMLELGVQAEAEHAGLAEPLIAAGVGLVFTAGPLMRRLHDAMPAALVGGHAAESATLAPAVAAAIRPGDVVLVKGSAGSRMSAVVQALRARHAADREPRHAV